MNYLAQGLQQGWATGAQLAMDVKRRKFEEEMMQRRIEADALMHREITNRKFEADIRAKEEREADPVFALQRERARRDLQSLDAPPNPDDILAADVRRLKLQREQAELTAPAAAPNPDDILAADVKRLKLQRERDTLTAPPSLPTPPMAKVTRAFGEGDKSRATFEVPMTDLERTMSAESYRSPYAPDIADAGRRIAEQQAEIEGGDKRTGFLNITSREDIIAQEKRRRRRLQAMEIQDALARGAINQAEADRRANLILAEK